METMHNIRTALNFRGIGTFHFEISLRLLAGMAVGILLSTCLVPSNLCSTTVSRPPKRQQGLYIGVMSANKFLSERVVAALETWARGVEAKIEIFSQFTFFSNLWGYTMLRNLKSGRSIIALPGVDDNAYPPQKKSFSAVKYMYDNYIDKYDWFLRLDDDAYVNVDKLIRFLSLINSSKPVYLGNPGYGANAGDRVPPGENFCMGGPGVIMSRGLLRMLGPSLKSCLGTLYTEHEDIEFGRCVTRVTGVKCTNAYDASALFHLYINARGTHPEDITHISTGVIDHALIYHCNKHREAQLSLHSKVLKRRAEQLALKIDHIQKDLAEWKSRPSAASPQRQHAVYSTYAKGWSYRDGPFPKKYIDSSERFIDQIIVKKAQSEIYSSTNKRMVCNTIQTYINPNSPSCLDLYVHVACNTLTETVTRRQEFRFSLKYGFTQMAIFMNERRPLAATVTQIIRKLKCKKGDKGCDIKHTPVHFILELSDRKANFERFLTSFEDNFLSQDDNVHLRVCQFCSDQSSCSEGESGFDAATHVARLGLRYPRAMLKVHKMPPGAPFSRGVGLQSCANQVVDDGGILYFVDVDLVFQPELLIHIRRNTVRHTTVFYPMFFSQYDPSNLGEVANGINETNGFWRYFSYGMFAIYKSDFAMMRGFDLKLKGWGLEDDHMLETIVKARFDVFRSREPAQFHIFHNKVCSKNLTRVQYVSCQRSRAEHMGSKKTLYDIYSKTRA